MYGTDRLPMFTVYYLTHLIHRESTVPVRRHALQCHQATAICSITMPQCTYHMCRLSVTMNSFCYTVRLLKFATNSHPRRNCKHAHVTRSLRTRISRFNREMKPTKQCKISQKNLQSHHRTTLKYASESMAMCT